MTAPAHVGRASEPSAVGAELGEPGLALAVTDYTVATGPDHRPIPLVDGISFGLRRGEILGLVGESGSGKTVTSLSLLGLLPKGLRVAQGSARLGEAELVGLSEREFARLRGSRIALVSQEPQAALSPVFTVGSQLTDVVRRRQQRTTRARTRRTAIELLASVHLRDPERVLRSYPHQLSGGMLQRVAIAMALAGDPEVLIADEPTTALDVTVQAGILALLREIRAQRSMSIILVTHDLAVVADLCDRVVVLRHGRIVENNDVDAIFESPEEPYTRELLAMTPNLLGEHA